MIHRKLALLLKTSVLMLMVVTLAATAYGWSWQRSTWYPNLWTRVSNGYHNGWYYRRVCKQWCSSHCSSCQYVKTYKISWYQARYPRVLNASSSSGYTAGTEGWRSRLLGVVESRERYANQAKASALEHNEFLETIEALGIDGATAAAYVPRYASGGAYGQASANGTLPPFGGGASYIPYAPQGNALYGYGVPGTSGVSSFSATYPSGTDIVSLLEMSGRLGLAQINNADKAHARIDASVSQFGSQTSETTRILASAAAIAQAVEAAKTPAGTAVRVQTETSNEPGSSTTIISNQGDNLQNSINAAKLWPMIVKDCVSCHRNGQMEGGLDLSSIVSWSDDQRANWYPKIRERVHTEDPTLRMPKLQTDVGYVPGSPLEETVLAKYDELLTLN